jgi:Fe-S-cluster containining protein
MEESLKMEPNRKNDDNICLACGLCCDGSLIGFVHLDTDEIPRLKEIMEIEETHGNGFFLQPCKKYCDGCTIYVDRPKNCDKFNCGLLKSVENKEIEFDYALDKIQEVKQRKITIEKQIAFLQIELKSISFYFKMVELKKRLKKIEIEGVLSNEQEALSSNLEKLDSLVIKEFGVSLD